MATMINQNRYPFSDEWEYETSIDTINFDEEAEKDVLIGKGFWVSAASKSIKKDLKDPDGIYSPRFGQTLGDVNLYIDRYKCRCGNLRRRINHGMTCPDCGTRCEFVDDDFEYFGWMKINDPYVVIHPAYYKKIERFVGKKGALVNGKKRTRLENMLEIVDIKNIDGHSEDTKETPKNEPFFGIGMIDFYERFDEIMDYYLKLQNKRDQYDDIMINRDKVFTHSIPVFTTLLRPTDIRDNTMSYEPTNAMYMLMNKLRTQINRVTTRMDRDKKSKNQQLYKFQVKLMELYNELNMGLSGKKGDFRCLMGGRYNFTARNVIVQNPNLRIDEITLSYKALVIMLEQRIKNTLKRLYNMSMAEAHHVWYKAVIDYDDKVKGIIQSIIQYYQGKGLKGIPVIINRNPTIGYGSTRMRVHSSLEL